MIDRDLLQLAEVLGRNPGATESLGLFLALSLKPSGYEATPACCRVFAWTGGDGVHFSFAELGDTGTPVVMTVPMSFSQPNLVVGKDIREFLALGLSTGYFTLEGLAYNREKAICGIESGHPTKDLDYQVLKDIAETFNLVPWSDPRRRLDALQHEFVAALT